MILRLKIGLLKGKSLFSISISNPTSVPERALKQVECTKRTNEVIAASELLVGEEYLGLNYEEDRDNRAFGQASGASIDRPLRGDFQAQSEYSRLWTLPLKESCEGLNET